MGFIQYFRSSVLPVFARALESGEAVPSGSEDKLGSGQMNFRAGGGGGGGLAIGLPCNQPEMDIRGPFFPFKTSAT
jgi:hypothetical protein